MLIPTASKSIYFNTRRFSMSIYIPYTYLIGWSSQSQFYYGRRTAKNCHPSDLWIKYFTSSKIVKQFIKDHGEPDIIEIRKTFTNSVACSKWECKVLERMDVTHNDKFLNQRNGDWKWDGTNQKLSPEHIQKLKDINTGRIVTDETRKRLSIAHIGKQAGENNPMYGRKRDDIANWNSETKAKKYLVSYKDSPWEEITNLYQFSKTNNLQHRAVYEVLNGNLESHKGWKFKHIDQ